MQSRPRVLHASLLSWVSQGVAQQLRLEDSAARSLGLPWQTLAYSPRPPDDGSISGIHVSPSWQSRLPSQADRSVVTDYVRLRRSFYAWLRTVEANFDIILLRYCVHDPFQARYIHRTNAFVGLIHHTFEVAELHGIGGVMGLSRASAERILGPRSLRGAKVLVGVTPDIADYESARSRRFGKATLIYPNGGPETPQPVEDLRESRTELIFVASEFSAWQGLDLLLASLQTSQDNFRLHLVGEVDARDLVLAERDERVRVHGLVGHHEIRRLASRCHAGISSLATMRQGLEMACPLKVREYLALGLPVVGAHSEVLPPEFPYYKRVSPTIHEILREVRNWDSPSRTLVSASAYPLISKATLLASLYEGLASLWNTGMRTRE